MDTLKAGQIIEATLKAAGMPLTKEQEIVHIGALASILIKHREDTINSIIELLQTKR